MTVVKFQEMLHKRLDEHIDTEIESHPEDKNVLCVKWVGDFYDNVDTVKEIKQEYHKDNEDTVKHIYPEEDNNSSSDSRDENPTTYYHCE